MFNLHSISIRSILSTEISLPQTLLGLISDYACCRWRVGMHCIYRDFPCVISEILWSGSAILFFDYDKFTFHGDNLIVPIEYIESLQRPDCCQMDDDLEECGQHVSSELPPLDNSFDEFWLQRRREISARNFQI